MTLQTIADALGVSRTTVSNAYNRPDQLAPELRRKVLEIAKELVYAGPDPAARRLLSGRRGAELEAVPAESTAASPAGFKRTKTLLLYVTFTLSPTLSSSKRLALAGTSTATNLPSAVLMLTARLLLSIVSTVPATVMVGEPVAA